MQCGYCGYETDWEPGELCPNCGTVLGPEPAPMTPPASVQTGGKLWRGVRRKRLDSPWTLAGAIVLFVSLALPAGLGVYYALRDAGGKPSTELILPGIALLLALLLARRWFVGK